MARFFLRSRPGLTAHRCLTRFVLLTGSLLNLRSGVRVGSRICEHTAEGSALPAWGGSQVEFGRLPDFHPEATDVGAVLVIDMILKHTLVALHETAAE
jgi:hypothetical protein